MACFGGVDAIAHGVGSHKDKNIRMVDKNMGHSNIYGPYQSVASAGNPTGAAYAAFATGVLARGAVRLCVLAWPMRASDIKEVNEPQGQWRRVLMGYRGVWQQRVVWL